MQKNGALVVIKKITRRCKQQRAVRCTCDLACIAVCSVSNWLQSVYSRETWFSGVH